MRGSIPTLPQYAFMAWCSVKEQRQLYIYLTLCCRKWEKPLKVTGNRTSTGFSVVTFWMVNKIWQRSWLILFLCHFCMFAVWRDDNLRIKCESCISVKYWYGDVLTSPVCLSDRSLTARIWTSQRRSKEQSSLVVYWNNFLYISSNCLGKKCSFVAFNLIWFLS